jgi:malonyl-CoA O-methyltransferase
MPASSKTVNKQAVAEAFNRAAGSYQQVADLQRLVGERLLTHCTLPIPRGSKVLDAGCGTGHFSRHWQQQGYQVLALDIAPGMLALAREQHCASEYLLGDIEQLPLGQSSVDLCFSNLALQWCTSLSAALQQLVRVTRPGGMVLFSTLVEGSLSQLAQTWLKVDGRRHVNTFLSPEKIAYACAPYRHQVQFASQSMAFDDMPSLLRSLKGIGATHLHEGRVGGLGGRGRLAQLDALYPRSAGQLLLDYQLAYGVIYC